MEKIDKIGNLTLKTSVYLKTNKVKKITFVCSVMRKPGGADLVETGIHGKIPLKRGMSQARNTTCSHHLQGRQELELS